MSKFLETTCTNSFETNVSHDIIKTISFYLPIRKKVLSYE